MSLRPDVKRVYLKFQGYQPRYMWSVKKILLTLDLFPGITSRSRGPRIFPTNRSKLAVLTSPFKHKLAQEHWELSVHRCMIWFEAPPLTAQKFLDFVANGHLTLHDATYRVEEHDFARLDYYYSHPSFKPTTPKLKTEMGAFEREASNDFGTILESVNTIGPNKFNERELKLMEMVNQMEGKIHDFSSMMEKKRGKSNRFFNVSQEVEKLSSQLQVVNDALKESEGKTPQLQAMVNEVAPFFTEMESKLMKSLQNVDTEVDFSNTLLKEISTLNERLNELQLQKGKEVEEEEEEEAEGLGELAIDDTILKDVEEEEEGEGEEKAEEGEEAEEAEEEAEGEEGEEESVIEELEEGEGPQTISMKKLPPKEVKELLHDETVEKGKIDDDEN